MPEVLQMIYDELVTLRKGQGRIHEKLNTFGLVAHEGNQRSKTNRWLIGLMIGAVITLAAAILPTVVTAFGG